MEDEFLENIPAFSLPHALRNGVKIFLETLWFSVKFSWIIRESIIRWKAVKRVE